MNSKTQNSSFRREIPAGDTHERDVCATCGFINYVNPKIVTGSIVRHQGKIMLCRRAIEPRVGYWTLPAGFMEVGETAEQAAMREAREEANAAISSTGCSPSTQFHVSRRCRSCIWHILRKRAFSAGPESLEVMLAGWDEIPWDDLAFPSVTWALRQYRQRRGSWPISRPSPIHPERPGDP